MRSGHDRPESAVTLTGIRNCSPSFGKIDALCIGEGIEINVWPDTDVDAMKVSALTIHDSGLTGWIEVKNESSSACSCGAWSFPAWSKQKMAARTGVGSPVENSCSMR